MTVEVQINHYDIRVLIDGLPQVYILSSEFVGFSSWADDNAMAVIEYHTKSGVIRTEFDDIKKWLSVLAELQEIF